ncbi:MAG: hypothetical protein ABI171_18800 [Collimonas sp.]|uniref:hypothetical protein n=1 Tax=Collimonas sp. TaxID=1963772 RepID=UPI0032676030
MRITSLISVNYLAEKEFLRYELLMEIAGEQTAFRWILSDLKAASVAILDPWLFSTAYVPPEQCICIWLARPGGYAGRQGDLVLPLGFRLHDLIDVLDQAALRLFEMKEKPAADIASRRATLEMALRHLFTQFRVS